ncbi:hypothetical protein C0J52_22649 [Blattella germanica]|nr:hypothetical protein C0J52_22649 [Blattella germanica]
MIIMTPSSVISCTYMWPQEDLRGLSSEGFPLYETSASEMENLLDADLPAECEEESGSEDDNTEHSPQERSLHQGQAGRHLSGVLCIISWPLFAGNILAGVTLSGLQGNKTITVGRRFRGHRSPPTYFTIKTPFNNPRQKRVPVSLS